MYGMMPNTAVAAVLHEGFLQRRTDEFQKGLGIRHGPAQLFNGVFHGVDDPLPRIRQCTVQIK